MANLALEYGFDPEQILDWSPLMFETVLAAHEFRVDQAKKAQRKAGR